MTQHSAGILSLSFLASCNPQPMSPVSTEIGRNGLTESMAFQNTWRSYPARVLEHLDSYLDDKRVHTVATSGSGKTVLGLEIIRRIDQPTLVLAPTITIRDQWVDSLVGLFLPGCHSQRRSSY